MKGITPYRKIGILVAFACAALFVQGTYYSKAAAQFASIQTEMEKQASRIAAQKMQILDIQRAREAALATEDLRDQLRARLAETPDLRTVVKQLEVDLSDRGYPPPHFSPHQATEDVIETGSNRFRVDGFDLTFEARFRDLVELLELWEQLPFGIRIEQLSVAPSNEEQLLVRLTVKLRKILTGGVQ